MALFKLLVPVLLGVCAYYFYSQETFSEEMVQGKRVLVTGASTGIGEQMAYEFARMGAHVMVTARRKAQLKEVVQKCRELGAASAQYVVADMSNMTSAKEVAEAAQAVLGGLDLLVLNHIGYTTVYGPFQEDLKPVVDTITVNFFSYVQLTISALKTLQESHGSIVVISSVAGRIPSPFTISYSASKFALEGFYGALRSEMRLRKIDLPITIAVLGYIDTDTALNYVGDKIMLPASPKDECAREIVKGAVLRQREVFYPYWQIKTVMLLRDWIPGILEELFARLYKLENIL